MRYAIISDIHANRQAWQAVSTDICCHGVDAIICLGDIVGYGPAPKEVLASVYEKSDYFVLGNHDAVVAGRLDPACFNAQAREVIEWTCGQLGPQAARFFNEVPFLLDAEGFSCAHADYAAPDVFDYIMEPADAIPSLEICPEPMLFVGHTHEPCVMQWTPDGRVQHRTPERLLLAQDWKYVINVGSVGDPRDGDLRASYAVLDLEAGDVQFRKVPFDLDAYRREHTAANLANRPAVFRILDDLPKSETSALAYLGNFSPIAEGIGGVRPGSERMRVKFDPEILRHMREQRSGGLSPQIQQQREQHKREEAPRKKLAVWLVLGCALLFLLSSVLWVLFHTKEGPTTAGGLSLMDLEEASLAAQTQPLETIRVLIPSVKKEEKAAGTDDPTPARVSRSPVAPPPLPAQPSAPVKVPHPVETKIKPKPIPEKSTPVIARVDPIKTLIRRVDQPAPEPEIDPQALFDNAANALVDGDMNAALSHLDVAGDAGTTQAREVLKTARDMERVVLGTFAEHEGNRVSFVTKRGPINVRIVEVFADKVRAERTVTKGTQSAAVPWEFTGEHLDETEFLRRAASAGKEPFYLYRGLTALQQDQPEQAEHHFQQLKSELGPALLRELERRVPERHEAAAATAYTALLNLQKTAAGKPGGQRLLQAIQTFQTRFGDTAFARDSATALQSMDAEARALAFNNLISNPDFDTRTYAPWKIEFQNAPGSAGVGLRMPGRAASAASVAIVPVGGAAPAEALPFLSQNVKVERAKLYEFSFWAVPQNPNSAVVIGAGEIEARVAFGPKRPGQNDWREHRLVFRAESAEVVVKMGGSDKTSGAPVMTSFDDVRLSSYAPLPPISPDLNFRGRRYRLMAVPADQITAQTICKKMGGHLLTLQNRDEADAVAKHWEEQVGERRLLLGLVHRGRGQYGWVTGETPTFSKLHPEFMGDPARHGECVTFGLGKDDTWDHSGRNRAYWFVCEWDR